MIEYYLIIDLHHQLHHVGYFGLACDLQKRQTGTMENIGATSIEFMITSCIDISRGHKTG